MPESVFGRVKRRRPMHQTTEQLVPTTADLVLRTARTARRSPRSSADIERVALSVAFSVLGNADAAADAVQDAFFTRLATTGGPERAWKLRHLALRDRAKSGDRRAPSQSAYKNRRWMRQGADALSIVDTRHDGNPLEELDRRERHELVAAALQSLDDVTRPAVMLRYYDGLSSKEIGEALGMSPAAVDMRLSRARQQLRQMLTVEDDKVTSGRVTR